MDAKQHLFYGLGQVAYAVAITDGKIQKEEEHKLIEIIEGELKEEDADFNCTEIIFLISEKDGLISADEMYEMGIKNIKLGDHYLTGDLKASFTSVITKVAEAFNGIDKDEFELLNRFNKDVALK